MKKSLFILFVLLFSQNLFSQLDAGDDYIFSGYSNDNELHVYFNKNIRKNEQIKNTYFVWSKWFEFGDSKNKSIELLTEGKRFHSEIKNEEQLFYYIQLIIVDIYTYKYKNLSKIYYDNFNNIIYSYDYKESENEWSYAVPNSMIDVLIGDVKSYLYSKNKKLKSKK